VALRGGSSKQGSLFRRLAKELAALLRRRADPTKHKKPRQIQRRLTSKHRDQMVTEYQAGASMQQLAERWGLHRTTVSEHLRRAGIGARKRGIPPEKLDEVVRLYDKGWSCQRLADRYKCDAETIRQALRGAGVNIRAPWERI
jgi:uncharacterized protein (DUF433 family)